MSWERRGLFLEAARREPRYATLFAMLAKAGLSIASFISSIDSSLNGLTRATSRPWRGVGRCSTAPRDTEGVKCGQRDRAGSQPSSASGAKLAGELLGALDPPGDARGFEKHLRLGEVDHRGFLLPFGVGQPGQIQMDQCRVVW